MRQSTSYSSSTMEFDVQNDDEKSGKAQRSVLFCNDISD